MEGGVTETPDMDVVIGYNIYPEGNIPKILVNAEPLPNSAIIREKGLPGFETVNESRRVIFRPVPGNNFFYELVKNNATHERIFLVCEPTEGSRLMNLSGRNFNILFVGREGKEIFAIRPCPNSKETVSVIYKQHELGRIIRHNASDGSEPSHTILNGDQKKIFILRKSYQLIPKTTCCFNRGNRKIDIGYNVFAVEKNESSGKDEEHTSVASITETDIKCSSDTEIGLIEKTLLFATLVSIKTKAMESVGTGFRISLTFPSI